MADIKFEDYVKEKLESIHDQVKTTNGRVQSLERWRSWITGGLAVLTIIMVPVVISVLLGWAK